VIPTVPREPLFWQGLAHCDNFQTSLEIGEADISKVVGEINGFNKEFFRKIPIAYQQQTEN
jgi:hypothetical protein